jgi:hypothetical protein
MVLWYDVIGHDHDDVCSSDTLPLCKSNSTKGISQLCREDLEVTRNACLQEKTGEVFLALPGMLDISWLISNIGKKHGYEVYYFTAHHYFP